MSDNLKYLPFVLIGIITLLQLFIYFSARRMRGQSVAQLEGLLDTRWQQRDKLVLYFSSGYCGPCMAMAPMIETLSQQHENLLKFDVMEHGELASRLGVRAAPAFVEIQQGRVVKVHLGALSESKLRQML